MATNSNTRQKGTLRPIAAALSAVVIAFCAWSMSQYVNGRDPLAFLGSEALQTTTEAQAEQDGQGQEQADAQASEEKAASDDEKSDDGAKKKDSKQSSKKKSSKDKASKEKESSKAEEQASDTAVSSDSDSQVVETTSSSSSSQQQSQGSSQKASASSSSPAQAETAPAEQTQPAKPQTIVVTLQVDGGAGVSSAEIELQPGSTALDVLRVAGVGIETISNPFGSGTWVTSIGGLAEDSSHGWTYRVNGSLPGVMSDLYQLSDGDTVLWRYV